MRILLDVDGVLGDFAGEVIRFCNKGLASDEPLWTIHDATDFDILEAMGLEHLQEDLDQHLIDTDYCLHMPVLPGAVEFVEKLYHLDHEVVVVTSPHRGVPKWCSQRMEWLYHHFGIHADDVIFARVKHRVMGDCLVDDKPENVEGFGARGILLDQPWNQDVRGAYRAMDYQDVVARLRYLNAS